MMGYDNVKIENDGYIPSSKTDVNTPYLPAVEEICRDIYGEYVIYPCRPSSAPRRRILEVTFFDCALNGPFDNLGSIGLLSETFRTAYI